MTFVKSDKTRKTKKKTISLSSRRRKCSDFTAPKPTCYKKSHLQDFVRDWNISNPSNKILINQHDTKQQIWETLRDYYGTDREERWIERTKHINKKNAKYSFAPVVPTEWRTNKNTWLSDEDIHNVMRLCEQNHEGFHFLEPAPIDFDAKTRYGTCAYSDLCNYTYKNLASTYNTFGAIFNTDKNHEPGQHWIALFVNLIKGEISYFDSVGKGPPPEINKLILRFQKQGNEYFKGTKKIRVNVNKTQHQQGNTECGIYCISFIYHMLITDNFNKFNVQRIDDKSISQLRAFFFDDIHGIYKSHTGRSLLLTND